MFGIDWLEDHKWPIWNFRTRCLTVDGRKTVAPGHRGTPRAASSADSRSRRKADRW